VPRRALRSFSPRALQCAESEQFAGESFRHLARTEPTIAKATF